MQVAAEQLISGTGADPALVPLAASYMRIRALAQPAVLVTMAAQGGLLAQRVRTRYQERIYQLSAFLQCACGCKSKLDSSTHTALNGTST